MVLLLPCPQGQGQLFSNALPLFKCGAQNLELKFKELKGQIPMAPKVLWDIFLSCNYWTRFPGVLFPAC